MVDVGRENYDFLNRYLILIFVVVFALVVVFLYRWQIVRAEYFQDFAQNRTVSDFTQSVRGDILTRDAETLAYSEPRYNVFVHKKDLEIVEKPSSAYKLPVQTREEFVRKVADTLEVDTAEIEKKLSINSNWIKIAENITFDKRTELRQIVRNYYYNLLESKYGVDKRFVKCALIEVDQSKCDKFASDKSSEDLQKVYSFIKSSRQSAFLVGLNFEFTSVRIYPENQLAAHVVGFLGKDLNSNDVGRIGLESRYDGLLEPQEGYVASELDKYGNLIAVSDSVFIRAKRGSTIKTTIDKTLQQISERKIKEGVEKYQAKSGSIVIMDPKTGEVLAMANYPTFDPNKYYESKDSNDFSNYPVMMPYEIGSIGKIFTMAAAVEELGLHQDSIVSEGHQGCIVVQASEFDQNDKRTLCTADKKPQGKLTASQAMVKSDNIAFIEMSTQLGKQKMYNYLSDFGATKRSGIDLPAESIGYLPDIDDPKAWHPVDVAVFSYGHGYQMNMMQTLKAVGSMANNGTMMQPYVVSGIENSDGTSKYYAPIAESKVVSESTADIVKDIMVDVYRQHTEPDFLRLKNYNIASKSGTAFIPHKDKAGYSDDVNVTYVGFDASEDAKFIMAVRMEAPQAVEKLSFYSARPLWMETMEELVVYFDIKPQEF